MSTLWTGLTRSVGCIPMCEIAPDAEIRASDYPPLPAEWFHSAMPDRFSNVPNSAGGSDFPLKLIVRPPPNKCGYMDHGDGCDCVNDEIASPTKRVQAHIRRLAEISVENMNKLM